LYVTNWRVSKDFQLLKRFQKMAYRKQNYFLLLLSSIGDDFIYFLQAAFTSSFYKQLLQKHWWLDCLFTLLGYVRVKALSKHVGEIDPRGWFHQHIYTQLLHGAPKTVRIQSSCLYLFILLGSTHAKADRRNFINVLCTNFSNECHFSS